MQGRVGVVHGPEGRGRHLRVHGRGERAENLAAIGAHHGGADEHAAVDILDDQHEAVVAGPVDPASCRRGDRRVAGPDRQAAVSSLLLGQADPTHLRVGEGHPGQPVVAAERFGRPSRWAISTRACHTATWVNAPRPVMSPMP